MIWSKCGGFHSHSRPALTVTNSITIKVNSKNIYLAEKDKKNQRSHFVLLSKKSQNFSYPCWSTETILKKCELMMMEKLRLASVGKMSWLIYTPIILEKFPLMNMLMTFCSIKMKSIEKLIFENSYINYKDTKNSNKKCKLLTFRRKRVCGSMNATTFARVPIVIWTLLPPLLFAGCFWFFDYDITKKKYMNTFNKIFQK